MKIVAKPIDVLAIFTGKNRPKPFKFKYSDDNEMIHEVRVDKIIQEEETKVAGIKAYIYRCQSQINGETKVYELKYRVGDCRWELYKM